MEEAGLQALLQLMASDLHITAGDGATETALWRHLRDLGIERGVITRNDEDGPEYRTAGRYGHWTLRDVTSDERKRSEFPHRRDPQGQR